MSEKLSGFEAWVKKISLLPGLGFLSTYFDKYHTSKARFDNTKGDYEGYVNTAKEAGGQAKDAATGGAKKPNAEDPESANAQNDPERP